MAAERGATVDLEGFEAAMQEQRERGQASARRVGFAGPRRCRRRGSSATTSWSRTRQCCASAWTARSTRSAPGRAGPCCSMSPRSTRRPAARSATPVHSPGLAGALPSATPSRWRGATPGRTTCSSIGRAPGRPGGPCHGRRRATRPDRSPSQRHPPAQTAPSARSWATGSSSADRSSARARDLRLLISESAYRR